MTVRKEIKVQAPIKSVFDQFLNHITDWWPKEYSWSKDKLEEMTIASEKNGLCTEIGPNGFRCDWGTVISIVENEKVELKWQISPKREPVPDIKSASDIKIIFNENGNNSTIITLEHFNFDNHGEGAKEYQEAMDSKYGWEYILDNFKKFCE